MEDSGGPSKDINILSYPMEDSDGASVKVASDSNEDAVDAELVFTKGQTVQARSRRFYVDGSDPTWDPFYPGLVTSVDPLEIQLEGVGNSQTFDDVRPLGYIDPEQVKAAEHLWRFKSLKVGAAVQQCNRPVEGCAWRDTIVNHVKPLRTTDSINGVPIWIRLNATSDPLPQPPRTDSFKLGDRVDVRNWVPQPAYAGTSVEGTAPWVPNLKWEPGQYFVKSDAQTSVLLTAYRNSQPLHFRYFDEVRLAKWPELGSSESCAERETTPFEVGDVVVVSEYYAFKQPHWGPMYASVLKIVIKSAPEWCVVPKNVFLSGGKQWQTNDLRVCGERLLLQRAGCDGLKMAFDTQSGKFVNVDARETGRPQATPPPTGGKQQNGHWSTWSGDIYKAAAARLRRYAGYLEGSRHAAPAP